MNLKVARLLLLLCHAALANDAVLTWQASPESENVTAYRVFERMGSQWVLRGTSPVNAIRFKDVSQGVHVYCVSAVNPSGEGPRSAPFLAPSSVQFRAIPSAPAGGHADIIITPGPGSIPFPR